MDHIQRENLKYAHTECILYCVKEQIFKACGQPKQSLSYQKCESEFKYTFFSNGLYDKHCLPACPLQCETEQFDYQLGFLNFPVESYFEQNEIKNLINRTEDFSILKQSVLKLTLRYGQLSYTHIVQEPKTFFQDLIANVGGTMGKYL